MPYGTVSNETINLLPAYLLQKTGRGRYRVDVVISGALDESFNVTLLTAAIEIAERITASLVSHKDLDVDEDFNVSVYDDHPEPPEIHWEVNGRRLSNDDLIAAAIKAAQDD